MMKNQNMIQNLISLLRILVTERSFFPFTGSKMEKC